MPISSEQRKTDPFAGNGSITEFPFGFKVFSASDVKVIHQDQYGVESELVGNGSDYSVTLNADQDNYPGGEVATVNPLAVGCKLVVSSAIPNTQETDINNFGGFYPKVVVSALDRLCAQIQQLSESLSRTVKVPISSGDTADELIEKIYDATGASQEIIDIAAAASASAAAASAAAAAAAQSAIDAEDVAGITLPIPVDQGGTGTTTAAGARTNLGLGSAATHAAGTGANEVLKIGSDGKLPAINGENLTNLKSPVKAWCVFNGTSTGTITPGAGLNVTSVTKNATGDYTINFTTALVSASYAVIGTAIGLNTSSTLASTIIEVKYGTTPTTTSVRIVCREADGSAPLLDSPMISVCVLGAN